ncbi:fumarylacetoacetase [Aeromicrobium wangtongii]|uniref:fumarylacetoacetase n=1 Tax=Aeromicrobium wangtongii TaxID=2969247 RepID=A0ABY5MHY1_9ACTN|nr:fumarylacetoacetase [Aeromicrobium wangtongii]MCD9198008.1 fumarylacetoacetase [Aeromicrobium wangtongii]UUP15506.1 fumarylacetoacetase [Aeromicrobium wangtongii]
MTTDFGRTTLPYCSFVGVGEKRPRVGVGVGTDVLDLTAAAARFVPDRAGLFADGTLDRFLAAGADAWHEVRDALTAWVDDPSARAFLVPAAEVDLVLPFTVADYVDFYASEQHATNVGRLFRPDGEALPSAWKHLPMGYHGRAGTVVVSGTPVTRPSGQSRAASGHIDVGPSARLDLEAEIGFVVGVPSTLGRPVDVDRFEQHVFGICVVNDWSARDLQAFEYVPLGPFLAKSFATSVSPWIVPLAALSGARVEPPARDPHPPTYLQDEDPWGLDLELVVRINDTIVSRPPFASMYWTPAQMLAHLTANGASVRTGDLYASGTVSGPADDQVGSLLELSRNGAEPVKLDDGSCRTFLLDGDEVTISATAAAPGGGHIALGEVTGNVIARQP